MNNNNQPPVPPPPAEPPALANDATQWRITWTAPEEEPEVEIRSGFRRAWSVGAGVPHIEDDADWDLLSRDATWALFAADAAVLTVQIASHPDGRTILLTRL